MVLGAIFGILYFNQVFDLTISCVGRPKETDNGPTARGLSTVINNWLCFCCLQVQGSWRNTAGVLFALNLTLIISATTQVLFHMPGRNHLSD